MATRLVIGSLSVMHIVLKSRTITHDRMDPGAIFERRKEQDHNFLDATLTIVVSQIYHTQMLTKLC